MSSVVDSSVVLGILFVEGVNSEAINAVAGGATISAVNAAEVFTKLAERGVDEKSAVTAFDKLNLTVMPFGLSDAFAVAGLRHPTRAQGLSLGDRACIALGVKLGAEIFTLDEVWTKLTFLSVPVRYCRT